MAAASVVSQQKPGEGLERSQWSPFTSPLFRGGMFGVNPFALMRQFTEDMETFGSTVVNSNGATWSPAIEVKQEADTLLVTAELPGLKKEDVQVNITEDVLSLEGERKQEKEERREGYYRSERSYGKFYRSVALPEGAKTDQASADFKDGVLRISIPVAAEKPKSKQIPVK